MKEQNTSSDSISVLLMGAILLANMDHPGLWDFTLRAVIGGAIWMAFMLATDYLKIVFKRYKSLNPS